MKRDYSDLYKSVIRACFERDKCCKMPGCKSKKRLQAHHIRRWADAPSLRYELFNLITLCKKCHDSIKNKESHYVSMFEEIVNGY